MTILLLGFSPLLLSIFVCYVLFLTFLSLFAALYLYFEMLSLGLGHYQLIMHITSSPLLFPAHLHIHIPFIATKQATHTVYSSKHVRSQAFMVSCCIINHKHSGMRQIYLLNWFNDSNGKNNGDKHIHFSAAETVHLKFIYVRFPLQYIFSTLGNGEAWTREPNSFSFCFSSLISSLSSLKVRRLRWRNKTLMVWRLWNARTKMHTKSKFAYYLGQFSQDLQSLTN